LEEAMNPMQLKDRAVGTMVGFAIGDALGMPAQYLTREHIRDMPAIFCRKVPTPTTHK
jgi:ADP-ribosylglycohydrolase